MIRKNVVTDVLVDNGVSLETQLYFDSSELYEFAEEICLKNGECIESLILDAQELEETNLT